MPRSTNTITARFGPGFPIRRRGRWGPRRSQEHHRHGSPPWAPGQARTRSRHSSARRTVRPGLRRAFARDSSVARAATSPDHLGGPPAPQQRRIRRPTPQDRTNPAGSTEVRRGCGGGHHHSHHDGPHADRGERPGRGEAASRSVRRGPAFAGRTARPIRRPQTAIRGGSRRGEPPPCGDVRLAALLLIAEEPRSGYQVIEELSVGPTASGGPARRGLPALAQLGDEA